MMIPVRRSGHKSIGRRDRAATSASRSRCGPIWPSPGDVPILMPELPDITVYIEALETRIVGQTSRGGEGPQPVPAPDVRPAAGCGERQDRPRAAAHREAHRHGARRRPVAGAAPDDRRPTALEDAGRQALGRRTRWRPSISPTARCCSPRPARSGGRRCSCSLGEDALKGLDPGGLEVLAATFEEFRSVLRRREPHAQAGPDRPASVQRGRQCLLRRDPPSRPALAAGPDPEAQAGRGRATLCRHARGPDRVDRPAAGRDGRRVSREGHGVPSRDGGPRSVRQPCPVCGAPVQRIRYAENETNYCPRCQTEGRILADRSLSRLLKDDWPRHLDDL